jgi:hypothetical protein
MGGWKEIMKTKIFALLLLAASPIFAAHFGIGIGIGVPIGGYYAPPPVYPPYYVPAPAYPGVGYTWIGGYYYPVGARWAWRPGYWARPPYAGAAWVAPRYAGGRYYRGYWRR